MNRGKLSHFTLFAFSLWISIFFAGALPGALFPITGLVCVAAALVLAAMEKPRLKRTGLVLGCLGLVAFIGGIRVPEVTRWDRYPPLLPVSSSYTAIPPDRVGQFRGFLVADSTAVAGSAEPLSRCAVKLEQVVSADGQQRGPAAGCILVWIRSGRMLFRGQEIAVHSGLTASREPGRFAYVSWAGANQLEVGAFRRGIDSARADAFAAVRGKLQMLDPSVSALLEALLLGRREELPGALYRKFQTSGALHILALSGLHLGILFFLLCLLLRFLPDRRVRGLIAGCVLLGYVFLVGWRPSLERAMVMLLVAAAGLALDREPQPLHLLGLAAALLLLIHPHYAFDLSFQLSFVSLAGIVILGPLLHRFWQPYLPAFVGWPLGASLSAQLATAPLVLHHFGAIYPVGVVAAVLLIPLVTIFLGAGVLFVGFSFLPLPLGGWIGEGLGLLYRSIDFCLDLFSRAPALYLPWRPQYWLLLAVLLIPLLMEARAQRRISPV